MSTNLKKLCGLIPVSQIPPQRRAVHSRGGRNKKSQWGLVVAMAIANRGKAVRFVHDAPVGNGSQLTGRILTYAKDHGIDGIRVAVRDDEGYVWCAQ